MAKRKADSPLHALSPNEPLRATRRSSRITPVSKWLQGKENENVRGSSALVKSELRKPKELRSGGESAGKRSRLGVDAGSKPDPPAAQNKIGRPPNEHSLSGNGFISVRKDSPSAERPLEEQLCGGLCEASGCCGGLTEGQDDFTDDAEELGRCLIYTRRAKSRTSKRTSPSSPHSGGQELPSRNRELGSGVRDLETCSESTSEEKGCRENQLVQLKSEERDVTPATVNAKEDAALLAKPIDKDQGGLYQIDKNNRVLRDGPDELTTADHHSPLLQEPAGSNALGPIENGSRRNLASHKTSLATEKVASVTMKKSIGTDCGEKTHAVLTGKLHGNEERCPTCSGVGRPSVDAEAAVQVLEEAYNKLYTKYQRLKTRNLADVEALYDEQTRKFATFSKAADALVEKLREENNFLLRQLQETGVQESINRSRQLEEEFIECRNDLVMERSKVLELEQELVEAHICILELRSGSTVGPVFNSTSDVPAQQSGDPEASQATKLTVEIVTEPRSVDMENVRSSKSPSAILEDKDEKTGKTPAGIESGYAEKVSSVEGAISSDERTELIAYDRPPDAGPFPAGRGGSKLMHELLQNLTQMSTFVEEESSRITFTHDESGFSFKLEQNSISREVGGEDGLLYHVLTPGTILHLGPAWMQSEIVFDMVQAHVFFQRILAVALGCHPK